MTPIPPLPPYERLLWQGHPSWMDHALLFLFMAVAFLRARLAIQSDEWLTAILYLLAIGFFFGIAALFHYSVFYQISDHRVRITSGLWRRQIRDIPLRAIESVTVKRELLNRWFDLGALEITLREGNTFSHASIVLKGVPGPDRIKQQLDRLVMR